MRSLCVFSLLFVGLTASTAWSQDQDKPDPGVLVGPGSGPSVDTSGPMRVELVSIYDNRVRYVGTPPQNARESRMQLNFRVLGDRVPEIVRLGNLILLEVVDSDGNSLFDPSQIPERAREATRPYFATDQLRQLGFVHMQSFTGAAARSAKQISVRGYVNVAYGGEAVRVDIERPLRYMGKIIDHPQLAELGVKIRMLAPSDMDADDAAKAQFGLEYIEGEEKVRNVTVYNEWLRAINTQPTRGRTDEDTRYEAYRMLAGELNNDCELAIFVYPALEKERIEFSFAGIDLP
ncbi:MAG: hypothetical protein D6744_10145 [Planctomycetota bacterium]|nr:MAG: hypothetical protein D6744_10145 [Planctomycetota bacterium]